MGRNSFALQVVGTSFHVGEVMAARTGGCWSHCIPSKEAKSDKQPSENKRTLSEVLHSGKSRHLPCITPFLCKPLSAPEPLTIHARVPLVWFKIQLYFQKNDMPVLISLKTVSILQVCFLGYSSLLSPGKLP